MPLVGSTSRVVPCDGWDIFIEAGQSNRVGFGLGPFPALDATFMAANVFQLGRTGAAFQQVIPTGITVRGVLYGGLHFWGGVEKFAVMGGSIEKAIQWGKLNLKPRRKILIVPAARGGVSISQWLGITQQPADVLAANTTLYDSLISYGKIALALPGINRIVNFGWHQGEAEVNQINAGKGLSQEYFTNLTTFFRRVRSDFGPLFPITAGHLVPTWQPDNAAKKDIDAIIEKALASDVWGSLVDTTGLTSNFDGEFDLTATGPVHFNAASQFEYGRREANIIAP